MCVYSLSFSHDSVFDTNTVSDCSARNRKRGTSEVSQLIRSRLRSVIHTTKSQQRAIVSLLFSSLLMMISQWILFFGMVLNLSSGTSTILKDKTTMRTYPVVDLMENSPIETRVMTFDKRWSNEKNKIILLNLNGYEKSMFSLINGSLFTSSPIDREEMVEKKRCLDPLYCLIEVHLIVNDAIEYWIVPIHILE